MNRNKYFLILAGVIAAVVLLFILFLIIVIGLTFDSFSSFIVLLVILAVGAAQIYTIYLCFVSRQASALLMPYQIVLFMLTNLFTALEVYLIFIYAKFSIIAYVKQYGGDGVSTFLEKLPIDLAQADSKFFTIMNTGKLHVSSTYVLLAVFLVVIYIGAFASIVYWATRIKEQLDQDRRQVEQERELSADITLVLHDFQQFMRKNRQLDFSSLLKPMDKLAMKSRSIRALSTTSTKNIEHRIAIHCQSLSMMMNGHGSTAEQTHIEEMSEQIAIILDDLALLDKLSIR